MCHTADTDRGFKKTYLPEEKTWLVIIAGEMALAKSRLPQNVFYICNVLYVNDGFKKEKGFFR